MSSRPAKPSRKAGPRAYSYVRFSRSEQMKGDSLRRQTQLAQEYADRHGLELDTELVFSDLGVSAYHGANFEGALGRFIQAVDEGEVAKGSYLLIENLDRFSRDKIMPTLNRFHALLEKGVNIVTLSDGREYRAGDLNDLDGLLVPLFNMARANEESEQKSRRLKAAWQNKRDRAQANGHKLTGRVPAWLKLRNREFEVIPERADVVRRIFELALDGHGKQGIAYRLNQDGVKSFGKNGWYPSYVRKILANEAVIGRFQPMRKLHDPKTGKKSREPEGDVIEGYFPAIIDPADFHRVRWSKPGASGHTSHPLANILSGLVVCFHCGSAMHFINKGKPPKGRAYLVCDKARRQKACDAKSQRYDRILQAVLDLVDLPTPWLLGHQEQDQRRKVRERERAQQQALIEDLTAKNSNLLANLQLAPSKALAEQLAAHEQSIERAKIEVENLTRQLQQFAGNGQQWHETKAAVAEFNRVMTSGDAEQIGAIRVRLNAHLKKLIDRVEVRADGQIRVVISGSDLQRPALTREVRDGGFVFGAKAGDEVSNKDAEARRS